ncbi:MAG: AMP-dependent synthetase [Betaproteobacteria bacterium RIFCSPLOWO2_12_FULL_65_14]|nr:MAG: AMP-dependent synthetase [Betaproteobacteria bacterium RIFCSPLOWO2_12_FULL_65_14]
MSNSGESQLARFLARNGLASYGSLLDRSVADPEWFWPEVMDFHGLHFFAPFTSLLDVSDGPEWARWCVGGTTNLAYNCLDRTLVSGRESHPAIVWEGEDGAQRMLSYCELASLVRRAAGALTKLGYRRGDVIALYMPMLPETVAAYLAIVSVGAIALPLFSGFGSKAVLERLSDAEAKAIITVDYTYRRGKRIPMVDVVDAVASAIPSLRHVIVVNKGALPVARGGRHRRWSDLIAGAEEVPAHALPAEAPAMIVYTSGTTGKPKGTVHTHCGFMTKVALDFGLILDLKPSDRLLWMSDMGWLTGPILAVAVPLMGSTLVLAEGVPDYPEPGRLWKLVEKHRITFLGVAPTMIRAFMQQAPEIVNQYDFSSLRITAATGEPWTPEAWTWFRHEVGRDRVPLLNYSGGTEIGGGIVAGTVLHPDLPPCAFAGPIPGMGAIVVDEAGRHVAAGQVGELALSIPSIGLTRGFWRDPRRYLASYWTKVPGLWMHGDFASISADGAWYIHGRSDDTIKIAGKRTGPAEIEAALLATGKIAEAAAVGMPDPVKGATVVCVCVPARGSDGNPATIAELKQAVADALGTSFRPKDVFFVADLPKTRTMKIMRRLIRSTLLGEAPGDLSGLVNPEALEDLRTYVPTPK